MKYSNNIVYLMRAPDEDFEVRITDDGRVIPVTDFQYLTVLRTIGKGEFSTLDLCSNTGIPQSSLYFILGKMVKEGLVRKTKASGKTYNDTSSSHVVLSAAYSDFNIDAENKIAKFWKEGSDKNFAASLISQQFFFNKTGIDFKNMIRRFGRRSASYIIDQFGFDRPEDVYSEFFDGYTLKCSVHTLSSDENTIEMKLILKSEIRDENRLILNSFIGLVIETYEKIYNRYITEKYSEVGEQHNHFTVIFESLDPSIKHIKDIVPSEDDNSQFMFVIPEGKNTTIVKNDAELKIIDMLSEGPIPMQTVILALLFPKSTTIMHIKTLMDKGIIKSYHAPSGALYLKKTCTVILRRNKKLLDFNKYTSKISETTNHKFLDDIVKYSATSLIELGFDSKDLAKFFGDYFADIEYSYELPPSPLDAIQNVIGLNIYANLSPVCTGISPLTIQFTIPNEMPDGLISAYMIDGLISGIIGKYHGNKPIISDYNTESDGATIHTCIFREEFPPELKEESE